MLQQVHAPSGGFQEPGEMYIVENNEMKIHES